MRSMRRSENGAAVVEFAILLLLLMPLTLGIIEYGLLWAQSHYVSQAAREGARAGARIATFDLASNSITNQAEVKVAVDDSVRSCLAQYYNKAGQVDKIVKIYPPRLISVGTKPALEVRVSVNSSAIWTPVLWQVLTLIPSSNGPRSEIRELSDTAVFAISGH